MHPLREVFNGLRYIIKTGAQWRQMPHDLPPWPAVYQPARRWLASGCFDVLIDDLRALLRAALGRSEHPPSRARSPSAVIVDSRALRSSPESGTPARAGYDGAKRKKGSKLHIAVDTPGHLLAWRVTSANVDERVELEGLLRTAQAVTDNAVEVAFADQGYEGEKPAEAAARQGVDLIVAKLPEAKKGFVLLPKRWIVERSFAWATRFRRLVRDYKRYASSLAGWHLVAFVCLMLRQAPTLLATGP